jgi:competence protein ComEC
MKVAKYVIVASLIVLLMFSIGCQTSFTPRVPSSPIYTVTPTVNPLPQTFTPPILPSGTSPTPSPTATHSEAQLTVSFMDVGQADCTVIQYGGSSMIIDAGGNSTASTLVSEIKNMGISKFDVVVGTHPHEDHIGGMDVVINTFDIGTIYMPKVANNTKTFEDVLTSIQNKGLTVTTPVPGNTFNLGQDVHCTILAPNSSSYSDLNSYSIVIKMVYGNTSFLFTGDAEADSEREMLNKGFDLKANVLKVGHHGSTSFTSPEFLKAVSPEYGVIFVGKDNTYGHPHQETLDKLNAAGVKVYRTDLNGNIVFTSNGSNINVTVDKTTNAPIVTPVSMFSPTQTSIPSIIPSPTPTQTPSPTLTSTPINSITLDIVSVTSPVNAGCKATIAAKTAPGAQCNIKVYYKSGLSSASGLSPKTADGNGNVSWTWTVGSRTTPGNWQIVVEANLGGKSISQSTSFMVE